MYVAIAFPRKVLLVKATLTVHLAHVIADAFTGRFDHLRALHCEIGDRIDEGTLGTVVSFSRYRSYCVDMTDARRFVITFSREEKPQLLTFQNVPARIVGADFEVVLYSVDCLRPGRIPTGCDNPAYLGPSGPSGPSDEQRSDDVDQ